MAFIGDLLTRPKLGTKWTEGKRKAVALQGCWPCFAIALWCNRTPESRRDTETNPPACSVRDSLASGLFRAFEHECSNDYCYREDCGFLVTRSCYLLLLVFFSFYLRCQPKHRCLAEWFNVLWIHGTCVSLFLFGFLVLLPWLLDVLTCASFRVRAFTCFIGENRSAQEHIV